MRCKKCVQNKTVLISSKCIAMFPTTWTNALYSVIDSVKIIMSLFQYFKKTDDRFGLPDPRSSSMSLPSAAIASANAEVRRSPSSMCIGVVVIIGRDLFLALFAQAPIICPAKISTIFISIRNQNQLYDMSFSLLSLIFCF